MRIKKAKLILLILFCAFSISILLAGCGTNVEKDILGTWEMEERVGDCVFLVSPIFYDNGTFSAVDRGWSSDWEIVNENILQIQWSLESPYTGTNTFEISVDGDEMILKTSEEDYSVYKRIS